MANGALIKLLENAAAGNGSDKIVGVGGNYSFIAEATWGGGSVKLQIKLPQGNYFDVASSTLSANGYVNLLLPPGTYRAVGVTGSAFYVSLVKID